MATSKYRTVVNSLVTLIRSHRLNYGQFNECCKLARAKASILNPRKGRILPQLLPTDALHRLYDTIDKAGNLQHQIMLRLLLYCGVRVSELVGIEVTHVDLALSQIFISQGKGAKDRVVLFPDSFRLVLRSHLEANPDNHYLFESSRKTKYTTRMVQKIVKQYARDAELPFHVHPHLLRHQMLTFLTAQGLTDAQIQLVSGHASKKSLERYQHLSVEHAADDYQKAVKGLEI